MSNLAKQSARAAAIAGMETGKTPGYYLVLPNGKRVCIGQNIHEARRNVDRACNRYLTAPDFEYWIDYSHGVGIDGRIAWSNLDHTDNII